MENSSQATDSVAAIAVGVYVLFMGPNNRKERNVQISDDEYMFVVYNYYDWITILTAIWFIDIFFFSSFFFIYRHSQYYEDG